MKKQLNVRLLKRLGVILLITAIVVHGIHLWQLGRHARSFRAQGEKAVRDRDFSRGAMYLGRALALRPNDPAVEGQYGLALEKIATNGAARWKAYNWLERSLKRDPGNIEVRQLLGQLAVKLGEFQAAVRVLEPLRQSSIDQGELEETLAWCHLGAGNLEKAQECFLEAIRKAPARVSAYEHLAALHLRNSQRAAAERIMDELVATNPRRADARLSRAKYREKKQQFDDARADFTRAVELSPKDASVLLEAAAFERRRGRPEDARPLLQQAAGVRDKDARPILQLVSLEQDAGHDREAIALLRDALSAHEPDVIALLGELLLAGNEIAEADRVVRLLPGDSPFAGYLKGLRLLRNGECVQAARALEESVGALASQLGWPERVHLALARSYAACGDVSRALEASARAAAIDHSFRTARLAHARALTAAGRFADACMVYQSLMNEARPPAAGWAEWARALNRRNVQSALTHPDWTEVDRVLARADATGAESADVILARAESFVFRNKLDHAETLLLTESRRINDPPELIVALADVLALRGRFADALQTLKKQHGREARLARIRYLQQAGSKLPDSAAVLKDAMGGLTDLPAANAGAVLQAMAGATRSQGNFNSALDCARSWCEICPQDLRAFLLRFDLEEERLLADKMRETVTALRRIEGENGLRWRAAEVSRLLLTLRVPSADTTRAINEAHRLLAEGNRLAWETSAGRGRLALATGRWQERAGQFNDAIAHYERAFEEGERRQSDVEGLAQMLLDRGRVVEADRVLRSCEREGLTDGEAGTRSTVALFPQPVPFPRRLPAPLARLGAEAALRQHDVVRVLELAPVALTDDSNHLDQLWLAGMYDRAGKQAEAIRLLERLAERSCDIGEVWVALLRQLVRSGLREKAEDVLSRAQRQLSEGDDLWQFSMAQCYEAVGRIDQAERAYLQAVQMSPRNPLVRRQLARFLLVSDLPEKAVPHLQELASSPYDSRRHGDWARRMLAGIPFQLLTLKREFPWSLRQQFKTDELIKALSKNKDSLADRRALALLTAAELGKLDEGLRRFTQALDTQTMLEPDERFRLAQLWELAGDRARADELMTELLAVDGTNPQYLAGQVRLLIGRDERGPARIWLKRLQNLEPDTARTRALVAELS
jgi:tetratricopeptide (TPR) repeat protein